MKKLAILSFALFVVSFAVASTPDYVRYSEWAGTHTNELDALNTACKMVSGTTSNPTKCRELTINHLRVQCGYNIPNSCDALKNINVSSKTPTPNKSKMYKRS